MKSNKIQDTSHRLGAQVWIEPTDSAARVDHLFATMRASGMGWARLFLMWPWIEAKPNKWDFSPFDKAFNAAERHGVKIKATLTANSGPWHIGTPSMLHSHTGFLEAEQLPAVERYIRKCVAHYKKHPALGQWLLWNEPFGAPIRTKTALSQWQQWLNKHYGGNLEALNNRWRTGYGDVSEIPFPEEVPHQAHRGENWNSYGPWLLDWQFRSERVLNELNWIRSIVEELDPAREIVINPNQVIANHASSATDLAGMCELADVLGASFHPAWHFTFAQRNQFPALIAAGTRLLASHAQRVEVTELQFGNTVNSSVRPSAVLPSELKRMILAGMSAGAEQVIGWCLNVRSHDFEAGDWGLLDNEDQPSARSEALRQLSTWLAGVESKYGAFSPVQPEAHILVDPRSQAVEWAEAMVSKSLPGRKPEDAAQGAGWLASLLGELGVSVAITDVTKLPEKVPSGTLIFASHLIAMEPDFGHQLIHLARNGAYVMLDATCGRKSFNADLQRPWPAGLSAEGLNASELESDPTGFTLTENGREAGETLLCRMVPKLSDAWQAYGSLRYQCDDSPVVMAKETGTGHLFLFRSVLGPSLQYSPSLCPSIRMLFSRLTASLPFLPRPANPTPGTISIPTKLGSRRALLLLKSPAESASINGMKMILSASNGHWTDASTAQRLKTDAYGELHVPLKDGIALIVETL